MSELPRILPVGEELAPLDEPAARPPQGEKTNGAATPRTKTSERFAVLNAFVGAVLGVC
jgi:hypothetical protein